ncbi:protein BIG GRAIN 1-like A [Salvia miltiorrhiza]|uniref:protein BIG GRAIN 1-like A n=1 Tax=Salvia miltiorrhiza TaxID=226208 RepID=UPI0025AD35A3|nr:protein BIG GRAIN 1-like A [Salvia miltiorrhiza]
MADRFSYSCTSNHSSNNLSFSSTLLEEIYQSIDSGGDEGESMRKKTTGFLLKTDEDMANYQRACMIERWMEKKAIARQRSTPKLQEKMSGKDRQCWSSSSSDSSCGAGSFFSPSEAESFAVPPPKPVRTGKSAFGKEKKGTNCDDSGINRLGFSDGSRSERQQKSESRFVKTKSKAQKIYGNLKRVKQPISPCGKVAAFLNSLLAAGNLKKSKIPAACGDDSPSLKSTTTTCSSPFSRSCLNRMTTPSSAKSAADAKRSVKFFPASDEDRRPCGRKSLLQNNNSGDVDSIIAAIDEELAMHVRKKEHSFDIFSKIHDKNRDFDREFDYEDDEFDGASCASSDLFELENLSAIGMEELPVYETTRLEKIMQMD